MHILSPDDGLCYGKYCRHTFNTRASYNCLGTVKAASCESRAGGGSLVCGEVLARERESMQNQQRNQQKKTKKNRHAAPFGF